jgi:rhomboid protease GluP
MAHSSRVCPHCGALNSAHETRCYRCGRAFPGPLARGAVDLYHSVLGRELQLTKLFIGLCVLVFALTTLDAHKFQIFGGYARSTELRFGALIAPLGRVEPWRYLSACFFHFGLLHLGLNMWALWDLGRALEPRLGSARFCIIFVVTGFVGFAASGFWYSMQPISPATGGASGGLFGLIGALVGYLYAKRDPIWKQFLGRVVIYTVIFSLAMPVNNIAHAVGGISGAPLGYLFYKEARPWRRAKLLGWIAAGLVVASLASVVLAQRSPYWKMVRRQEIKLGMQY